MPFDNIEVTPTATAAPAKNTLRQTRVAEPAYVKAIARWLDGEPWAYDSGYFAPYHGLTVKLREESDTLTQDGIAILRRFPIALVELPGGTKTTARTEARALAAVALRGDADMYG